MFSSLPRSRGHSSTLLLVLGVALVTTVTLISVAVVWNSYRQAEQATGFGMVRSVRLLEQGLTRSLEAVDATLMRVSELLDGGAGRPEVETAMLDAIRFAPHIRQILIVGPHGRVLADSARPRMPGDMDAGPPVDLSAWGLGPAAPRSLGSPLRLGVAVPGRYLHGGPRNGEGRGHWVIPVSFETDGPGTPVATGGDLGATAPRTAAFPDGARVVAALNPDFFLRAFSVVLSGPAEEGLLIRYDGAVLASHGEGMTAPPRQPWGWDVAESLRAAVHDGLTDRLRLDTPIAGRPGTVAVRLSEVYPVAVALAYSEQGLRAEWLDSERGAVLALGLGPVLLGILALVILVLTRHRLRLRSELRVLSRVVEEAPVAVIVTNRDGRIEFVNDNFTHLLGYQPSEVINQSPSLLKSGHSAPSVYEELWQTIMAGGVWHGEFLNRTKDGRLVWMSAAVSGVRDDDGHVRRFVAVETDVTERKRAEATLSAMINRLDVTNRELEQFARVASHDLQEPLRMVTGYLSLLERRGEGLLPDDARGYIQSAINGADRMRGLIKDLLAYSQVSNRQVSLRAVSAENALRAALAQLQDKIVSTGATLRADALPQVLAEERNLSTLFRNLIDNALTHSHPARPPMVDITCEAVEVPAGDAALGAGHYWSIRVKDNGRGIDERDFDRVFRLFQHLQSREDAQGNGVGLAVARRIVERAGGAIRVSSDGRTGSTFEVLLPRADGHSVMPDPASTVTPAIVAANDL